MDGPGELAGRQARLLVVEDDHNHCYALQRAFERRGYDVKSANSVPQALAVFDDWSAAYAVIDLRLPGASGLALVARLKTVNPEIRIVMMTGYASIATAVEAIKLGAVHYLAKPVDVNTIEAAFQHRQQSEGVTGLIQPMPRADRRTRHDQSLSHPQSAGFLRTPPCTYLSSWQLDDGSVAPTACWPFHVFHRADSS